MSRFWTAFALLAGAALLCPAPAPAPRGMPLRELGELPVLHEGRLKPLETVARSTLLALRGRQTARDGERTVSAVEWLLEAAARPQEADRLRVFRVEDSELLGMLGQTAPEPRDFSFEELAPYLGRIEAQAARAAAVDSARRPPFDAAVVLLDERLRAYDRAGRTLAAPPEDVADPKRLYAALRRMGRDALFRPVPADAGGGPEGWLDLGTALLADAAGSPRPAERAYAELAAAWSRGDAARVTAAAEKAAAAVRQAQPRAASLARWEALFDRAEPFYRGMIAYVAALLLALAALSPRLRPRVAGPLLAALTAAFVAHTAGLGARVLLQGRPPVTNLYSSAVFVGWAAAALGLWLERARRDGLGALAASATGFSTLLIAHHLASQGDTMEMMRAVLDSNFWLSTHVVTITLGYGAMFVAAALAHVFILRRWLVPGRDLSLDRPVISLVYGVLCAGLFFSFVGTVLGGIWADRSWGRFWGWDPKENGALLIVLWAAVALHARWGGYVRERGLAAMAVLGSALTSLSWFGVNMLGVGLHSYGFMDKAVPWLAGFCALECGVAALAFCVPTAPSARSEPARRPPAAVASALAFILLVASAGAASASGPAAFLPSSSKMKSAIKAGDTAAVGKLLDEGFGLDAEEGPRKMTPLKLAVEAGQRGVAALLLDRGADINLRDNGTSALTLAALAGDKAMVELLLSRGAEPNERDEAWARGGDKPLIVELLRHARAQAAKTKAVLKDTPSLGSGAPPVPPGPDLPAYKTGERPDDVALVVSVESYMDASTAPYAARDAESVARHLEALGWPARNIVKLTGEGAGRSQLTKYLERWLPNNVGENTRLFFYFAGDGAVDAEGRAYLLPWDGDAAQLEATAYPTERLFEKLDALKVRSSLVVLDAGFSGAGPRSVAAKGAAVPLAKPRLGAAGRAPAALLAQSGGKPLAVDEPARHGALTLRLLEGLNGAAADAHGAVTLLGIQARAREGSAAAPQLLPGGLGADGDLRLR